ncbi:MAG TPA: M23 family metallopeptidase, partial [Thermomicrobiaceae bacterium]|nr:M23 family metallopeptidase [Thermomicrobiaceae bacterium]
MPKYRDDSTRRVTARLLTVLALLLVIVPSAVGATGDTTVPTQSPNSVVPAPFNANMSWSQEGGWHWVNLAYTGDNSTVGTPVPQASYVATLVLALTSNGPCGQCVAIDDQQEGPPSILDGATNPQLAAAYADLDNGPRQRQSDGSWPIGAWYLNYSPASQTFFSWTWIPGAVTSPSAQVAQFGTVATSVGASQRVFPLVGAYTVTQPFGCVAANPGYPTLASCPPDKPSFHDGVDLGAPAGTPIVAAASGTV